MTKRIIAAVLLIAVFGSVLWWMMSQPPKNITMRPGHIDILVNLDGEFDEYYEELKVYANGKHIKSEKVSWYSEDENVATVEDGWVTSMGVGKTIITAAYKGRTATCTVMVKQKITSDTLGL